MSQGESVSLEQMRRLIQEELAKQLDGEEAFVFCLKLPVELSEKFDSFGLIWEVGSYMSFKQLSFSVQPKWLTSWLSSNQPM